MKKRILSVLIAIVISLTGISVKPHTVSASSSEPGNRVLRPVASPSSLVFETSQTVALSSETEDAEIYYTLDGTLPSTASSLLYAEPFTVTETTAVRAIAVKNGMADSEIMTAMFINKTDEEAIQSRMDSRLRDALLKADEDDLIDVWVWRPSIPQAVINAVLAEEFFGPMPGNSGSGGGSSSDGGMTHEEADAYIAARRLVVMRLHTESNRIFRQTYINPERKILYEGVFTSTFIIEASPSEIMMYTVLSGVISLSLHEPARSSNSPGGPGGSGGSGRGDDLAVPIPAPVTPLLPAPYEFTTRDALNILRYVAGLADLTAEQRSLYDLNGDGEVNTADALAILRIIAGL
jgi:hypothetical protein